MAKDLYGTLGVQKGASRDAIKRAYRKRARETHPDAGGDAKAFAEVSNAYTLLTDDRARERYDATGRTDSGPDADEQATAMLAAFFTQAIEEAEKMQRDPMQVDLVADVRKKVEQQLRGAVETTEVGREKIERERKYLKRSRMKRRGQPNLIEGLVNQRLAAWKAKIEDCDRQAAAAKRALELLVGYEWQVEQPAPTYRTAFWPCASSATAA